MPQCLELRQLVDEDRVTDMQRLGARIKTAIETDTLPRHKLLFEAFLVREYQFYPALKQVINRFFINNHISHIFMVLLLMLQAATSK